MTGVGQTGFTAATNSLIGTRVTYGPANLDARSATKVINDTPATADVYLLIEEIDALTANTDFKIYASRIGDTGYVEATEEKLGVVNGIQLWRAVGIDLSSQASQKNLRWHVVSANNKNFKIYRAAVYGRL